MQLAYDEEYFKVTNENVEEVSYLRCNHKEADTRILLHVKDASQSKDAVPIAIPKADIIGVPIYMKRRTQNRKRFVDITNISTNLGSDLS